MKKFQARHIQYLSLAANRDQCEGAGEAGEGDAGGGQHECGGGADKGRVHRQGPITACVGDTGGADGQCELHREGHHDWDQVCGGV